MNPDKPIKVAAFDLDGTLCTNTWGRYDEAERFLDCVTKVNQLYDAGHTIKIYTAIHGYSSVCYSVNLILN